MVPVPFNSSCLDSLAVVAHWSYFIYSSFKMYNMYNIICIILENICNFNLKKILNFNVVLIYKRIEMFFFSF